MKIVKRVGERLLPRWLADELRPILTFTGTGAALWAGSCELVRRGWNALGEHLNGWERLGALAAAGYALTYACWHTPRIAHFAVPFAGLAWCVAALCVSPAAEQEQPSGEAARDAAEVLIDPHQMYARWLLDTIGNRPGIHLQELYPKMRELPGQEGRPDIDLRCALKTFGVPVHRSLRIGRVAGRSGVRREDVQALLHRLEERGMDFDGDAGQNADSPLVSATGERMESA